MQHNKFTNCLLISPPTNNSHTKKCHKYNQLQCKIIVHIISTYAPPPIFLLAPFIFLVTTLFFVVFVIDDDVTTPFTRRVNADRAIIVDALLANIV